MAHKNVVPSEGSGHRAILSWLWHQEVFANTSHRLWPTLMAEKNSTGKESETWVWWHTAIIPYSWDTKAGGL
jgi:hypothetical protein